MNNISLFKNVKISLSYLSRSFRRKGLYLFLFQIIRAKGIKYIFIKLTYKLIPSFIKSLFFIPFTSLLEVSFSNDLVYYQWLIKNYPRKRDLQTMAATIDLFRYKPIISIVLQVLNNKSNFLYDSIDSVLNQVYPYWELCLVCDYSNDTKNLEEYIFNDSRIKIISLKKQEQVEQISYFDLVLEKSKGEFITLLDTDSLITPDALYEIALILNKNPHLDIIYSDSDEIDSNNKLQAPFFKPDWCPDSFLSRMYTGNLGVYRRSIGRELKSLYSHDLDYKVQYYDFVLKLSEKTNNIFHISKILYHERCDTKKKLFNGRDNLLLESSLKKVIEEAMLRRNEPGKVYPISHLPNHYIVRYQIKNYQKVSIIIPTRDLSSTLNRCLQSIFQKTTYPNYEVIVIDNGSVEPQTATVINYWQTTEASRFSAYPLDIPFNYSKLNNYAVNQAKGEYLVFLNNDTEVITSDWLEGMVEQAQRPSIGAVGTLLLYPDNLVQHAGVVLGIGDVAGHVYRDFSKSDLGYFGQLKTINNFSALTGACLMCRREIFESVGGFEEELSVAYNDVDLCLKIVEKGYKNVYLPHVVLYHHEYKTRGYEHTKEKQDRYKKEVDYMHNKWKEIIANDPCYNSNLTRNREDYSLKV